MPLPLNQTQSGKALEYALALAFAQLTDTAITDDKAFKVALSAYNAHDTDKQEKLASASRHAAAFLLEKDIRLQDAQSVSIAPDSAGQEGDVRDIIIAGTAGDVGISAKRKNDAVKHSRLSPNINFGEKWVGYSCRDIYFQKIAPVFDLLQDYKEQDKFFRDIDNKQQIIYKPILDAFEDEMHFIWENFDTAAYNLLQYLIGREDFYWVIQENGSVSILSCNIQGSLKWGKKWKMPTSIESTKREGENRFIISFNNGWQISFRIHNARSRCEPSLKFDVRIVGWPRTVSQQNIDIHG